MQGCPVIPSQPYPGDAGMQSQTLTDVPRGCWDAQPYPHSCAHAHRRAQETHGCTAVRCRDAQLHPHIHSQGMQGCTAVPSQPHQGDGEMPRHTLTDVARGCTTRPSQTYPGVQGCTAGPSQMCPWGTQGRAAIPSQSDSPTRTAMHQGWRMHGHKAWR